MLNNYLADDQYHPSNQVYLHPLHHSSLHLGDMSAAADVDFLQRMHIKTVITAAAFMDHIAYEPEMQIKHVVYPLDDVKTQNIAQHFNPVYELIEKQLEGGSVLVHCAAGISRSATLVIAYLMKHNNWTFHEAIDFVRKSRPKVCPNLGFQRQLKQYQKSTVKRHHNRSLVRKEAKTSQYSKHASKKNHNIQLPEIMALGKTQLRSIVFDPFIEKAETRASRRGAPSDMLKRNLEMEQLHLKLRPLKVRKTKSLAGKQAINSQRHSQRQPLISNLSLGVQSVFISRLNIGESKTERLMRRRQLLQIPRESYGY